MQLNAERLDALLGTEPLAVGDLILTEVLLGFSHEKDFNQARRRLTSLDVIALGGADMALQAAGPSAAGSRRDGPKNDRHHHCHPLH